ncbi:MAG: competence/damage-inducible protein A [Gammaproteobacteria bacterium]
MTRPRIGFLIIGDEILSGRTAEKNLPALSEILAEKGLAVDEARIVRDAPPQIAAPLRQMRAECGVVFTSGGIGPTHDDMTADGVALAFGVAAEENKEAAALLADFYARRGLEFTPARRRMARAPKGAAILKSEFPGAPGFVMENVFVCAGVPEIFRLMAAAACARLPEYPRRHSVVLRADCPESELAAALADIQRRNPRLQIGSYPRADQGAYYSRLVFGGEDKNAAAAAMREMADFLSRNGYRSSEIPEK